MAVESQVDMISVANFRWTSTGSISFFLRSLVLVIIGPVGPGSLDWTPGRSVTKKLVIGTLRVPVDSFACNYNSN